MSRGLGDVYKRQVSANCKARMCGATDIEDAFLLKAPQHSGAESSFFLRLFQPPVVGVVVGCVLVVVVLLLFFCRFRCDWYLQRGRDVKRQTGCHAVDSGGWGLFRH